METNHNILEVQDLTIGYDQVPLGGAISFNLEKGTLCAIVGVNGIGKSTLLRTLGNLQPKISGEIILVGKPQESLSPNDRARLLSLVLTEPMASKNLTVSEVLTLGRQPYTNWLGQLSDADKEAVANSLSRFDLNDLAERKCFELSDGQLQRVLIARAMTQDTPLILLDEPTAHLDLYHKVQIFKLLQQLAHQHQKTIVFTTHEIDLAIQLCDKILLLDGKTNAFASPCELIEKGSFSTLFPSEMVRFDEKTGTFKVSK